MTSLYGYIAAAGVVFAILVSWVSYERGVTHANIVAERTMELHLSADRKAESAQIEKVRKLEKEILAAQTAVSEAYEKGKKDAEVIGLDVVTSLRNGNLRLQKRWANCDSNRMPDAPTITTEFNAATGDRDESAGRIIRAAAQCDAQVVGLQNLLRLERPPNKR